MQVLVAHAAAPDVRAVYARELSPHATLVYLDDLPPAERVAAAAASTALLTFFTGREIAPLPVEALARVRFVQSLAAGKDRFPWQAFPRAQVAFNQGAAAGPVAEHAVALVLAGAKRLGEQHAKLCTGVFDQLRPNLRLRGGTAVVVGLGGIGSEVTRLLRAFGMQVIGVNRSGLTSAEVDECVAVGRLAEALVRAEVVVLALELNADSEGLVDAAALARMKPAAVLVNVARARIVREKDLYEHLVRHPDFTACLDVWWAEPQFEGAFSTEWPLLSLPNVLGSPHNAGQVPGIHADLARAAARKLLAAMLPAARADGKETR